MTSALSARSGVKMDVPLGGSGIPICTNTPPSLRAKFAFLPKKFTHPLTDLIERKILDWALLYYRMPQILLAPNQELMDMLTGGTGRQSRLMIRGVDTEIFSPEKRTVDDGILRFGFVGRLRDEKNVRFLADLEKELLKAEINFKFLIVAKEASAAGSKKYEKYRMTGFLEGEKLSEPTPIWMFLCFLRTRTFRQCHTVSKCVGCPVHRNDQGGPKFIVQKENRVGRKNLEEFSKYTIELMVIPKN